MRLSAQVWQVISLRRRVGKHHWPRRQWMEVESSGYKAVLKAAAGHILALEVISSTSTDRSWNAVSYVEKNRHGWNTKQKKLVHKALKAFMFRTARMHRCQNYHSTAGAKSNWVCKESHLVKSFIKARDDRRDLFPLRTEKCVEPISLRSSMFTASKVKNLAM